MNARVSWRILFMLPWVPVACAPSGGGDEPRVRESVTFARLQSADDLLTSADVDAIVRAAAEATDSLNVAIAVTDRVGNVVRLWNRNPGSLASDLDNRLAVSLARTAAYLSHSQAPLTSRTGQFISTSHFPAMFDTNSYDAPFDPTSTSQTQPTTGVDNTPQGPLWQIDASNRGAFIESALTNPITVFDPGKSVPQLTNPDGCVPGPGFTALPGGVPLYKRTQASIDNPGDFDVGRRLVGAVGVYVYDGVGPVTGTPRPGVSEFAAFEGSLAQNPASGEDFSFGPIPREGAVFLVGILLPYLGPAGRPAGTGPGTYDPALTLVIPPADPQRDGFGYLISPRDSASVEPFRADEVDAIIQACVAVSRETQAAIRLPADVPCAMIITVTDLDGVILGAFRMEDATMFSLEISITKARNAVYYSNPASRDLDGPAAGQHPLTPVFAGNADALAALGSTGIAVTARTLGFLSQPFYPPGIEGTDAGPLFDLALENRKPSRFDQMGYASPAGNDTQSGIIFFPGSAPLYRNGVLIGGIGVSGDGVEQDDFVTARGIERAENDPAILFELEPPPEIRCDNFEHRGVRLPYFKFPQNPGG